MRFLPSGHARLPHGTGLGPALREFAAECGVVAKCLAAYLGALAAIAGAAVAFVTHWDFDDGLARLPLDAVLGADRPQAAWRLAPQAPAAFAVSQFDTAGIVADYEVFLGEGDGRRDIFRWTMAADHSPVAGLRIDRPAGDLPGEAVVAVLAEAGLGGIVDTDAAGVIDSKFGPVRLLRLIDGEGAAAPCLGFVRSFARPSLRFEGWSCRGETAADRRAAVACLLNRLVLLTAGNDARLAELFAHAELRRPDCVAAGAARQTADWIVGAHEPRLRGAL